MFSVEAIMLPVSDVDRAARFYVDRVGFTLDVDYALTEAFRVVQLTRRGSSCSSQIGVAFYYDIGDTRNGAWSCGAPFEDVARIADLVSFYPETITITIDRHRLEPAPGQTVISHGLDRNLSVDEVGGIRLVEDAAAPES